MRLLPIELGLCVVAAVLSLFFPCLADSWFKAIERRSSRFATRRHLSVLIVFLVALIARLAVLPIEPIPAPGIHDEFSYLLMSDTFAHGRLTNPPHRFWKHFESMAIIQQPTYCSMYYPAQGLSLAFGQRLFGHPFWGVWLSTGLMCAAICWALQGWMPPAWAFLGGILAILRLGTFSYWADSYWGGSVAAIGGALALGALPRIKRYSRPRDALLLGLGFAVLANSRPYEALFYSAPILIALVVFLLSNKRLSLGLAMRRIALPLAVVMVLTFLWMGFYFWRTTRNPFLPPYLVDVRTYIAEPQFIWQEIRKLPPTYNHATMRQVYEGSHLQQYWDARQHPVIIGLSRIVIFWLVFFGPILTAPLFLLASVSSTQQLYGCNKEGFLILLLCVSFAGLLLPVSYFSHYAAPITCLTYVLILQVMRRAKLFHRWGRRRSQSFVRLTVANCFLLFGCTGLLLAIGIPRGRWMGYDPSRTNPARVRIAEELYRTPGHYLIFVHYSPEHDAHDEWVYNDADIDGSKIVWAREMDTESDAQLIEYFKNRQVLTLDADAKPPQLREFR